MKTIFYFYYHWDNVIIYNEIEVIACSNSLNIHKQLM
jgi:hypothetical protein